MDKVLEYPLTPVSMTLFCADSTGYKKTNSRLLNAALND